MKLTQGELDALKKYTNAALDYACKKVHRIGKRDEVGITASIATFGAEKIMKLWGAFLINKGYKISVQTSFCHQTPYVKIQSLPSVKSSCEIGDLLFIVREKAPNDLNSNLFVQTLLLQVKKNRLLTVRLL